MPTTFANSQIGSQHRQQLKDALGVDCGNMVADKLDGLGSAGTKGTSLTVKEQSKSHNTRIEFTSLPVTITDSGGANGGIGSKLLYTFPQGLVNIRGARSSFTISVTSGIGATGAVKHSVGSAAVSGNDTLNGTEANIIPSTSTTLSSSAGTASGKSIATALVALTDNSGGTASDTIPAQTGAYVEATQETTVASLAGKINEIIALLALQPGLSPTLDGVSAAAALYLNFGVANGDISANATVTITGFVEVDWSPISAS